MAFSLTLSRMLHRLVPQPIRFPVACLAVLLVGCALEPEVDTLTIGGHGSHLNAVVEIDGTVAGQLQPLDAPGPLLKALMPKPSAESPLSGMVALNVPIDPSRMPHGVHTVRVTRPGQPGLAISFRYPFTGPERHCLLFATDSSFVASDSCATDVTT